MWNRHACFNRFFSSVLLGDLNTIWIDNGCGAGVRACLISNEEQVLEYFIISPCMDL